MSLSVSFGIQSLSLNFDDGNFRDCQVHHEKINTLQKLSWYFPSFGKGCWIIRGAKLLEEVNMVFLFPSVFTSMADTVIAQQDCRKR